MVVSQISEMVSQMQPVLHPDTYIYTFIPLNNLLASMLVSILDKLHTLTRETEGYSLLLPKSLAEQHSLPLDKSPSLRHIELRVYSSLEGIGLTAAVAEALTAQRIACNVIAGLQHDHVFVPESDAEKALQTLLDLASGASK